MFARTFNKVFRKHATQLSIQRNGIIVSSLSSIIPNSITIDSESIIQCTICANMKTKSLYIPDNK